MIHYMTIKELLRCCYRLKELIEVSLFTCLIALFRLCLKSFYFFSHYTNQKKIGIFLRKFTNHMQSNF